ncbi:MAG: TlpA family protein disulfide reductase [Halarcobacter sp.]
MKLFLKFAFLFVVIGFFAACSSEDEAKTIVDDSKSFSQLKKESNKNFKLTKLDNKKLELTIENGILSSKTLNGKYVLVNFWATWCPPCIKEIPTFNRIYEKYKDKFEIIGVLYEHDKNIDELKDFIKKHNIKFPVVIGEENFRLAKLLDDVKKVPESFLYSKDGKYIRKYIGEVDAVDLENVLKK